MGQVLDIVAVGFCNFLEDEMDCYVGSDVSLRSVAVCVIDSDGNAVLERSEPCGIEDISHYLLSLRATELRIGFEAGAMSQLLFFGLQAAGFDVVCIEARQVNAALSQCATKLTKPTPVVSRKFCDRVDLTLFSENASTWPMRYADCSGSSV